MMNRESTISAEIFDPLVSPEPISGCWLWVGRVDATTGYGRLTVRGGRQYYVHRIAYVRYVGPIPIGYQVHHKCGVKSCVNHDHLALIDIAEHGRISGRSARTDVCPKGHPRPTDRTKVACPICNRVRSSAWKRAKREAKWRARGMEPPVVSKAHAEAARRNGRKAVSRNVDARARTGTEAAA
jgi:hypothetical protein